MHGAMLAHTCWEREQSRVTKQEAGTQSTNFQKTPRVNCSKSFFIVHIFISIDAPIYSKKYMQNGELVAENKKAKIFVVD